MNTECEVRKALTLLLLSKNAWEDAEKKRYCGTKNGRFYVIPKALVPLIGEGKVSRQAIGKVLKDYSFQYINKRVNGPPRFWYCIDLAAVAEACQANFVEYFCRRWGISQDEFFGVEEIEDPEENFEAGKNEAGKK